MTAFLYDCVVFTHPLWQKFIYKNAQYVQSIFRRNSRRLDWWQNITHHRESLSIIIHWYSSISILHWMTYLDLLSLRPLRFRRSLQRLKHPFLALSFVQCKTARFNVCHVSYATVFFHCILSNSCQASSI